SPWPPARLRRAAGALFCSRTPRGVPNVGGGSHAHTAAARALLAQAPLAAEAAGDLIRLLDHLVGREV
ncbi:hypothetical protein ABT315_07355, partial [Streptomyces puniciscabiei]